MVVEVMPLAGVRMSRRSSVVSVERVAYVVDDRIEIVQRPTSTTCNQSRSSRSKLHRKLCKLCFVTSAKDGKEVKYLAWLLVCPIC